MAGGKAVTLNTKIYILDEIGHKDVFGRCNQLINAPEATRFSDCAQQVFVDGAWVDEPTGARNIGNDIGQGLCALLDVYYRTGGPLKSDADSCDRWCDDPCDAESHDPAHWIKVTFDTAYGYRDEQGRGCGDLHAVLVAELGRWLDERGVRWLWENEFTGEIHSGYERLIELCSGGFEASAWFQSTVMPAISADIARGERS